MRHAEDIPNKGFAVVKYRGKWSVLDTITGVYYYIGKGYKVCREACDRLNKTEAK